VVEIVDGVAKMSILLADVVLNANNSLSGGAVAEEKSEDSVVVIADVDVIENEDVRDLKT
jgi:hypothetical protein